MGNSDQPHKGSIGISSKAADGMLNSNIAAGMSSYAVGPSTVNVNIPANANTVSPVSNCAPATQFVQPHTQGGHHHVEDSLKLSVSFDTRLVQSVMLGNLLSPPVATYADSSSLSAAPVDTESTATLS